MTASTVSEARSGSRESGHVELGHVRNITKANVRLESRPGGDVIVKTVADRPWCCRWLIGGFLVRREGRALERLQGTAIAPRLLDRTRHGLVMEHVEGERLGDRGRRGIDPQRAREIESAFEELHRLGIAHGDVAPFDIILRPGGGVVLLDFATAVGPGLPPLLGRLLLPIARRADRRRVGKLVRRYVKRHERHAAPVRRARARDVSSV